MLYSLQAIFKNLKRGFFVNAFLYLLLFSTTYAEEELVEKQTIRGTHWGMTKAQVKAKEKWKFEAQTDNYIIYSGELKPGVTTALTYEFYDGVLVGLAYSFGENKKTYLYFRSILGEKYGLPYDERTQADSEENMKQLNEIAAKGGVAHLGYDLFQGLKKAAQSLHAQWKIHKQTEIPNTYLSLRYRPGEEVKLFYVNFKYMNEKEQLKKDKERDAKYSLQKGNDL